jgi:predicted ATPase/DNA-binding SARP family transcriptional activator
LLLINHGRSVSADQLIDEIWAGEPPDGAATTIRSYVSRLRDALGGDATIAGSGAGYSIVVGTDAIDSARFERLVREGDDAGRLGSWTQARDRMATALAMWRGRPFAELADDGALRIEADRLDELRLHALERKIEADIELGRSAEVIDELESLVGAHPYRERLWQLLMLALYHSDRQADALAAYQRARRMLDEHLGLEPGSELRTLEGRILRQEIDPVGAPERRASLPADLSTFIGRAAELRRILDTLDRARLVTLTGVGGVGKTRLAIEAARHAHEMAPDGAVFVDLATVTEAAGVARAVGEALDVREQPGRPALDAVSVALRNARLLLVLDNCEHVLDAAGEVAGAILAASPDVRVIATSRAPLGVAGEVELALAPLAVPGVDAVHAELVESDAVRLLLARATQSGRSDDGANQPINEEALREAARICRDLDGIPLAIELAAARSKALSLSDIASRLDDRFRFLVSWRRVSSARHQTLRQAMDWSFDLLSRDEQRLLARLSVFVGGFGIQSVAEACLDGDEAQAVDLLGRLVDASLVIAQTSAQRSRYRMLETVRQYAAARLTESGATAEARAAHAVHFAALAARAEPELTSGAQTEWFGRLDEEHANLLAALATLSGTPASTGTLLETAVALTRFWYVRGHLAEAREWLERAVASATTSAAPLRRRALTAAASIALLQGDYTAATHFAEDSLAAARETGEERLVANGLTNLGAILLAGGERDRSRALLEEAVSLAREVGDSRILALALNNLGDHALTSGEYEQADPLFAESLDLLRARGDTANIARSLFNLGAVALRLGRTDDAAELFHQGLAAAQETGDKEDTCWCLLGLATVAAARGNVAVAASVLGAATALLDAMGAAFKPFERTLHDETEAQLLALSTAAAYRNARAAGARMTVDEAVELASSI